MKTYILALVTAFSLSGCFYQSVNSSDIETAIKICAKKDAVIVSIEALFTGNENVICSNRATYGIFPESN